VSNIRPDRPSDRTKKSAVPAPTLEPATEQKKDSTPKPSAPPPIVRFSINLGQDSADLLKGTAAKKNITVTDATRRAIAIMALMDEELEAGNTIQSVDPAGGVTRIVFV
jgi:hypothetical protein